MSIKSLLFFLFLYICLVWVGAALLREGPQIRTFGLFWTAVGLIAVISWVIISWVWSWFRVAKARAAARPKATPKAAPTVSLHEEDAALLALVQEARISLTRSPALPGQSARFDDLPLYLLVGPEGAGKTSTFINSTLEPVSLSGQPGSLGQTIPTRIANIWIARNALFIELAGRAFSGDLTRWASLLRTLRGGSTLSRWQRFFKEPDPGLNLRGILALGDVKEFMGATSPQGREKLERLSTLWRERLSAITEVFGRQYPVYWITTKTDMIPYFADYFARLRGTELSEIFGCTLPLPIVNAASLSGELASAQAENKRLTKSTSPLLHRLAERRVIHLAREDDPRRKPGVYEFPREMRRIRPTLVQFLVDVFRPHPLRHTPFLRGYYFTGTCEEEVGFVSTPSRSAMPDDSVMSDATAVFKTDATQVFKASEAGSMARPSGRGPTVRRWAFVPELLNSVVLRDNAVPRAVPLATDPRVDLYRKVACGSVCFVSLLLGLCFLRSWAGNSHLLDAVNKVANGRATQNPTVGDLRDLDQLREQVLQLSDFDRNGPPWHLRWGLYTGGDIVRPARDLYFRRLDAMLLYGVNDSIVVKLRAAPAAAEPEDPNYALISDQLRMHLMMTSDACKPDTAFASRILRQTLEEGNPAKGYEWRQLANRQIEFYASELPSGNPIKMNQDSGAVDHARQYLRSVQGADQLYAGLLSNAEKRFGTSQTLTALAPDYSKVLNGSPEVNGVFTPEGWSFIKSASKNVKANMPGDACLEESKEVIAAYQQDAALENKVQRFFVRDYIANWQKFVKGFSVARYNGPADAARKLQLLSDHRSPLLAVFALASKNTYFPPPQPTAIEKSIAPITSIFDKAKQTIAGVKKEAPISDAKQIESTTEIFNAFQPVQWVVPGGSETWVTDKNNAYIDSLAQLGMSMDAIAHSPNPDPTLIQAANQNYDKAVAAARQLEERLSPNSNGLDTSVQRLLEEPIRQAKNLIPETVDLSVSTNRAAAQFCTAISGTLRKFPFQVLR